MLSASSPQAAAAAAADNNNSPQSATTPTAASPVFHPAKPGATEQGNINNKTTINTTTTTMQQQQPQQHLMSEYDAAYTYRFLRGVDTIGTQRPKTVRIPAASLNEMANMERQFWDIKSQYFDIVVFFKKGKFYELYDCDAVIANRDFGLKMTFDTTNRGKMRMAGVPEQTFSEWARLFVFRGHKVGRVEQMSAGAGGGDDDDVGGEDDGDCTKPAAGKKGGGAAVKSLTGAATASSGKCIQRELVQILTSSTVTDAAMISNFEPCNGLYLNLVVVADGGDSGFTLRLDAVCVDLSRRSFQLCGCGALVNLPDSTAVREEPHLHNVNVAAMSSLLQHTTPREVVIPSLEVVLQQLHQEQPYLAKHVTLCYDTVYMILSNYVECGGYASTVGQGFGSAVGTSSSCDASLEVVTAPLPPLDSLAFLRENPSLRRFTANNGDGDDEKASAAPENLLLGGSSCSSMTSAPRGSEATAGRVAGALQTMAAYLQFLKIYDRYTWADVAFEPYALHHSIAASFSSLSSSPTPQLPPPHSAHGNGNNNGSDTLGAAATLPPVNIRQLERNDPGLLMDAAAVENLELVASLTSQQQSALVADGASSNLAAHREEQSNKNVSTARASESAGGSSNVAMSQTPAVASGGASMTLYGFLNHCTTAGGRRLLKAWILCPSASATIIHQRQCIVRHVFGGDGETSAGEDKAVVDGFHSWRKLTCSASSSAVVGGSGFNLSTFDIERQLARLLDLASENARIAYVDPMITYKKNLELILSTLNALETVGKVAAALTPIGEERLPADGKDLFQRLLRDIQCVPALVREISAAFDRKAAINQERIVPAPNECKAYDDAVAKMDDIATMVDRKLQAVRERLNCPDVALCEIGKDLFLFDIPVKALPNGGRGGASTTGLASTFVERTRSAKSAKFSDTSLEAKTNEYRQAVTERAKALVSVQRLIAAKFRARFPQLMNALRAVCYLDVLHALAAHAKAYGRGNVCLPKFVATTTTTTASGECGTCIEAKGFYHPMVAAAAAATRGGAVVRNDLTLGKLPPQQQGQQQEEKEEEELASHSARTLLLTGPNMAGKSTLMRSLAIACVMSQLGGYVHADSFTVVGGSTNKNSSNSCETVPITRIFTRIGARDATHRGQSTLMVELEETSSILHNAGPNSLCLVDELGRGTSTHDGMALAEATLHALAHSSSSSVAPPEQSPLVVFSTHYHAIASTLHHQQSVIVGSGGDDFSSSHKSSTVPAAAAAATGIMNIKLGYMNFLIKSTQSASKATQDKEEQQQQGVGGSGCSPSLSLPSSSVSPTPRTAPTATISASPTPLMPHPLLSPVATVVKREREEVAPQHGVQEGEEEGGKSSDGAHPKRCKSEASIAQQQQRQNNSPQQQQQQHVVEEVVFLYRLVPGLCHRSYGVEVALKAGVPFNVVVRAQKLSNLFVQMTQMRELQRLVAIFAGDEQQQQQQQGRGNTNGGSYGLGALVERAKLLSHTHSQKPTSQ